MLKWSYETRVDSRSADVREQGQREHTTTKIQYQALIFLEPSLPQAFATRKQRLQMRSARIGKTNRRRLDRTCKTTHHSFQQIKIVVLKIVLVLMKKKVTVPKPGRHTNVQLKR